MKTIFKISIVSFLLILIHSNVYCQFEVKSDGVVRLHTSSTGAYSNSFISYANNDYHSYPLQVLLLNHYLHNL